MVYLLPTALPTATKCSAEILREIALNLNAHGERNWEIMSSQCSVVQWQAHCVFHFLGLWIHSSSFLSFSRQVLIYLSWDSHWNILSFSSCNWYFNFSFEDHVFIVSPHNWILCIYLVSYLLIWTTRLILDEAFVKLFSIFYDYNDILVFICFGLTCTD